MEPKAHIFACDKAAVYGDVEVVLGPDIKIQKMEDIENEFHFATGKEKKKTFTRNLCATARQNWSSLSSIVPLSFLLPQINNNAALA